VERKYTITRYDRQASFDSRFDDQCSTNHSLQVAWVEWIQESDLNSPFFFTGHYRHPHSRQDATKKNLKFLKILNEMSFGRAGKMRGKKPPAIQVTRFPVIEKNPLQGGVESHHSHIILDVPYGFDSRDFINETKSAWYKANDGACDVDVRADLSSDDLAKCAGYTTKARQKDFFNFDEFFDFQNVWVETKKFVK
jgi:hypothetical protein